MDRWTERFNSDGEKAIVIHDGSDFPDVYFEGEKKYDAMNAFADYEDLEEQGLLLKLPCKVGDSVFIINEENICRKKVKSIKILSTAIEISTSDVIFHKESFGETVFLTRAEAEKKLEVTENEQMLC